MVEGTAQRLDELQAAVEFDNGMAIQMARYSNDDVRWLIGLVRGQADALQAAQLERDSAMASLARGEAIHAEALAGWSTTEAALQAATDERDATVRDLNVQKSALLLANTSLARDRDEAEAALQRVRALVERWDAASSGASRERAFINKLRNAARTSGTVRCNWPGCGAPAHFVDGLDATKDGDPYLCLNGHEFSVPSVAALGVGVPTESEPTILDDLDRARHLVRHEPFPYQPNPGPLLPVPENPTTETQQ